MKRNIPIPTGTLWRAGLLLLPPLIATRFMQFTYGALSWAMSFLALLTNALCIAPPHWPLYGLTGRTAPCCIDIHIVSDAWGAANCLAQSFRGTPILSWDLSALGTVANVAGSYRSTLMRQMLAIAALAAALVVLLHLEKHKACLRLIRTRRPLRLVCLGTGLVYLLLLLPTGRLERFDVKTDAQNLTGSYRAGDYLAVFLRNTELPEVEKPEDVTPERLGQIMAGAESSEPVAASVERPDIVVTINESWTNFEDYGNLIPSVSVTNHIRSLDDAVHSRAYTSVSGMGTNASEFGFLAGNPVVFLPLGSIPYQQYVLGLTASLASILRAEDHSALVFRSGGRASQQRDQAYPRLGSGSYKCGDDMDVPQTFEHGYVSDQSDFEQIIQELEHKEEEKSLFLFGVIIQNHGDYIMPDYPVQIIVTDAPGEYLMAEQYLVLASKTDAVFRALVEYLRVFDESTIVIMFGDHQPSVEQGFLDLAYDVTQERMTMEQYMGKYYVPFIVWASYPLPGTGSKAAGPNFLGQYLLRCAGTAGTPYGGFLWQFQEELPVPTFVGYMDAVDRAYSHLKTSDFTTRIEEYQRLQYNNLFGG